MSQFLVKVGKAILFYAKGVWNYLSISIGLQDVNSEDLVDCDNKLLRTTGFGTYISQSELETEDDIKEVYNLSLSAGKIDRLFRTYKEVI